MNNTRTKIICTIGPSVNSKKKILALTKAGMNVARLNFSHGTHEEHLVTIKILKEVRKELEKPLAIMLDTKGAEIRTGKLKKAHMLLTRGQKLLLIKDKIPKEKDQIPITPSHILKFLKPGMAVFFNDGLIASKVISIDSKGVLIQVENAGDLSAARGVNIPGAQIDLLDLTQKDIEDIKFGCKHGVDIIAASFVRSAKHIIKIKKLLAKECKKRILIIAKIENEEGVQDIDSIVQVADGIMIARGDLGVEFNISQVPKLQKMIIKKCLLACKPSVTATQMLESMIHQSRPTRAEASDVANAIYDMTSAVMLSGETAVGKYPIKSVQIMHKIIKETEADVQYEEFFFKELHPTFHSVASSIAASTAKTAYSTNAKAIFVFTSTGQTARLISRLRPSMPIIALTQNLETYNQLAFNWGVIPIYGETCHSVEEAFKIAHDISLEKGYVHSGDLVVITAGTPFDTPGTTNMMIVENIGNILLRCHSGIGEQTSGITKVVLNPKEVTENQIKGKIVLILKYDKSCATNLRHAKGIILQNLENDKQSEESLKRFAIKFKIPILLRADEAFSTIKDGKLITIDPQKALIYDGGPPKT